MFENIVKFFKSLGKSEKEVKSKDAAKERLHLVLMQDRANISADFLALMKQEIIEVIKKYIDVDENAIDVRLTNKSNEDGTTGAPVLYANIPIVSVKDEAKEEIRKEKKQDNIKQNKTNRIQKKEPKNEEPIKAVNSKEFKEDKHNIKSTASTKTGNLKKKSENDDTFQTESNDKTSKIIEKAEKIVEKIEEAQ